MSRTGTQCKCLKQWRTAESQFISLWRIFIWFLTLFLLKVYFSVSYT